MKDDKENENLIIEEKEEIDQKVLILGNQKVGKSSLIGKALNTTGEKTNETFEFHKANDNSNNYTINYQIYEICLTEYAQNLINSFKMGNPIVILVYSIDNKDSFNNIQNWIYKISDCENIIIVGNKTDLGDNKRVVTEQMLENFFYRYKYSHLETSAKYGNNVEKLKELLKEIAINRYEEKLRRRRIKSTSSMREEKKERNEVEINKKKQEEKKECCCKRCFN